MHLLNIHHQDTYNQSQNEGKSKQAAASFHHYHSIPVDLWICNLLPLTRENVDSIPTGVSASSQTSK